MIEPPRPTPAPITTPPITTLAKELISDIEKLTHLLPNEELLRKVRAIPNEANAPAERSSAADLVEAIAGTFSPSEVSDHKGDRQNLWVLIGLLYMSINRISTSLAVFKRLYDHILIAQEETNTRYHKGVPLVWMSDCYDMLGYHATAQRHLMLTLVEDAIIKQGKLSFGLGIYYRLVWTGLLSESEWRRYGQDAYSNYESDQKKGFYPEWILQELDRDWVSAQPGRITDSPCRTVRIA